MSSAAASASVSSVEASTVLVLSPRSSRAGATRRKAGINRVYTCVTVFRLATGCLIVPASAQCAKNSDYCPNQGTKANHQDKTDNVFHRKSALQTGFGQKTLMRGQDV